MRDLRLTLYFLVGMLLVSIPIFASAESIPATSAQVQQWTSNNLSAWYPSPAAACAARSANMGIPLYPSGVECYTANGQLADTFYSSTSAGWVCPAGQNWTLVGTNCTRPDCTLPQVRDPADGVCKAPTCAKAANEKIGSGFTISWPVVSGVQFCSSACSAYPGAPRNKVGGTAVVDMYSYGTACTGGGSETEPTETADPTDLAPPPCLPGQGSYTSVGGVVMCTAAPSPNVTKPPVVTEKKEVTAFPDGSTKTVTTNNTCTGDGACSTTTVTNVTPATAGGAGSAGNPGTTTGQSDKPAEETSDFCAKNPTLQFCKGGMNEEATQKSVLSELKKLTTPDATDDSSITSGKHSDASQTDLEAKEKAITDAASGVVNPTSSQQSAWEAAMSSGWFSGVPMAGCSPVGGSIGSREWSLDICPVAAKISTIGDYVMWFGLLVGGFVMLTGGRRDV